VIRNRDGAVRGLVGSNLTRRDRGSAGGRIKRFLVVNEHPVERVIRVLVGLVGISLVFVGPKTALGWFGIIPLPTGVTGLCPLYTLLGISTCPRKAAP
jgi:hypothetical protein